MPDDRPPWEEYQQTTPAAASSGAPWEDYTRPPNPQESQHQAIGHFFDVLGQTVNPMNVMKEYASRRQQRKAAADVYGTQRGSPEEAAAVERGMNTPLSNPLGYTAPPLMEPIPIAMQYAQQGDPAGYLATLTGAYGVAPLVAGTALKAGGLIARGPGRALLTQEGRTALSQAQGPAETIQVITRGPDQPVQLMTQALKPRAANLKFNQQVDTALPEIKASESAIGRPIANIDDMLEAVQDAKKRVWSQREAIAGPQSQRGISLDSVADEMDRTVSKYTEMMEPAEAQAVRDMAAKYRGKTFTIEDAEGFLRDVNKRLNAYYAKNPAAQRVAAGANPDIAALDAQARGLRNRIYGLLDSEGQGAAPRELSRRYGALLNVEEEIYRRKNVADRQAPVSLSEQIGGVHAAGKIAKGMFRTAKGDLIGGAADILEAGAMRKMASELKEANTTNALIERTFRNYNRKPLAVDYRPVQPKALLGPGPMVTEPPADPSGIVRGAPGPPAPAYDPYWVPPRPLLNAPGRPPIVTPAPADPSGIRIVPGQPYLPPGNRTLPPPGAATPPPGFRPQTLTLWDLVRYIAEEKKRGQ